jgi:RNA polymerase sigma-70 factor, ECF subfamily
VDRAAVRYAAASGPQRAFSVTDPLNSPQFEAMEPARIHEPPVEAITQRPNFTTIFDQHFDYVWFTLKRFGVAERDLEDVAHETFIHVFQQLDRYDASRPIRPWLFGFAYRKAADYRRLARHRVERLAEPSDQADQTPSAAERAASRQTLDRVWEALQQLELDRRAVFVLHDVEGYSIPEVADALSIPLNTAYSRLRLAREQFAKAVQRLRLRQGEG